MRHALVSLVFCFLGLAQAHAGPHHEGTLSSINVGFRYSSVLMNRGVILYDDFQIDPVFAVFLLDDRIEFLGDSIGYRDFVYEDVLRLRGQFRAISDDPLFPERETRKSPFDRDESYEAVVRLEAFLPGYNDSYAGEIDITVAHDLKAHRGNYLEIGGKVKLTDFRLPVVKTQLEPNLTATVGYGSSDHNAYFYGPSAKRAGINNLSYGITFQFPEEADRYYPIIQLTRFQTIGSTNRRGEYARSRDEGVLFSVIATAGLLN